MSNKELQDQLPALIEALQTIVEDTTGPAAANVATTDENLSAKQMYQQTMMPSLGRQIFSVLPMTGPTAALFNIRKQDGSNDFELVRNEVEVFPCDSIKSGLTQEVVQDIKSQYGKETTRVVGTVLRGLSNAQENEKTIEFLNAECVDYGDLSLSGSTNAESNLFELTQRVQEIVLKINSKSQHSFQAFAVIPYQALGGIMALKDYVNADDKNERNLFISKIGLTNYFLNPDATATTAYVGITDQFNPSKSSAVFSPYMSDVVEASDYDNGSISYHIFNRFAITASPLHDVADVNHAMMYKFTVTV